MLNADFTLLNNFIGNLGMLMLFKLDDILLCAFSVHTKSHTVI